MIFVGGEFKAHVSPPFADFMIFGFAARARGKPSNASGRNGLVSWMTATAKQWPSEKSLCCKYLSLKNIVTHKRCCLSASKDELAGLLLDTCAALNSRRVWNAKESKRSVQLPRNSIRALSGRRGIRENGRQSRTPTSRKFSCFFFFLNSAIIIGYIVFKAN